MKTRKNKIVSNKTRKGGKTAKENFNNYINYWQGVMRKGRPMYPKYDAQMNYPGYFKKLRGEFPSMNNAATTLNTYTFSRHGYSCANLLKSQESYQQFTDPDPSLTTYGILSILKTISPKPHHYTGKVFVSSLIRTWQTAILEYGSYPEPLTIIISPYIKEKQYENKVDVFGVLSSLDVSNIPLPLDQQIRKMKKFLEMLNSIPHEKIESILTKDIQFIYDKKTFTLNQSYEPYTFVSSIRDRILELSLKATSPVVNTEIFIPRIKIKEPSYTEYFGAEGFVYFDHWVRQHYPDRHVFVVSHSGFMKSILKKYSDINVETEIFNQNVWKLVLQPVSLEYNYKVYIYPGIVKPSKEILSQLSKDGELLCHRERGTSEHPISLLPKNSYSMNEQYADPLFSTSQDLAHEPSVTPRASESTESSVTPRASESTEPSERSESYVTPRASDEMPEIGEEEKTSDPPMLETYPDQSHIKIKRSYRLLREYLSITENQKKIVDFLTSRENFKTKCKRFIQTDDIFSNHYLALVLMYPEYLDNVIEDLNTTAVTSIISGVFLTFGHFQRGSIVATFLQNFSELLKTDDEIYNLMIDKLSQDANTYYYHKMVPIYLFGTLLDLFYFQLNTFELSDKEPVFRIMRDLISKGARFGKRLTIPNNLNELLDCVELLSDEEVTEKLTLLNIPSNEKYKDDLHAYLELSLSKLYSKMPFEELRQFFIKEKLHTKLGAVKDPISIYPPRDEDFFMLPTMGLIPLVGSVENYMKRYVDYGMKIYQLGGSRGTSSKKTSLRRFSVKGERYQALQYKGKKRSKANRK
jgi:hypothetical protein